MPSIRRGFLEVSSRKVQRPDGHRPPYFKAPVLAVELDFQRALPVRHCRVRKGEMASDSEWCSHRHCSPAPAPLQGGLQVCDPSGLLPSLAASSPRQLALAGVMAASLSQRAKQAPACRRTLRGAFRNCLGGSRCFGPTRSESYSPYLSLPDSPPGPGDWLWGTVGHPGSLAESPTFPW